jgi:hypothetical protein
LVESADDLVQGDLYAPILAEPEDHLQWARLLDVYDIDTRISLLRSYANFLAAAKRAAKKTEPEEPEENTPE